MVFYLFTQNETIYFRNVCIFVYTVGELTMCDGDGDDWLSELIDEKLLLLLVLPVDNRFDRLIEDNSNESVIKINK